MRILNNAIWLARIKGPAKAAKYALLAYFYTVRRVSIRFAKDRLSEVVELLRLIHSRM